MKLPAVYHNPVSICQFNQFPIDIVGHGAFSDHNEFQVFVPAADRGIIRIGGKNVVSGVDRKQRVVIGNGFRQVVIKGRIVFWVFLRSVFLWLLIDYAGALCTEKIVI